MSDDRQKRRAEVLPRSLASWLLGLDSVPFAMSEANRDATAEDRTRKPNSVSEFGSSGWTRTSNPLVNRLVHVLFLEGSSSV